MHFEKAVLSDIPALTDLRIAYLQEDLGAIAEDTLHSIGAALPVYFEKHLNNDLMAFVAREGGTIISCAFLLIVEKPMSPAFITGKTATVMNVYTMPEHRHKGYARKLMTLLLKDAKALDVSIVELKATEDGYPLYRSLGFEEAVAKYHSMRLVLG
ncbi:MAG: GNAT family N-acetyltransferase [Clostridia bacterium]|nr:GNAT family N-acetyltransferase [Clostridia bacterium]